VSGVESGRPGGVARRGPSHCLQFPGETNTDILHPEYVVGDDQQPRAVILPIAEWERILEQLEELDDIRAYDRAKEGPQEAVPFDQAVREIEEDYGA
jgi:hypothetical protein